MYYPRFTKVIINHFMSKDQSIPRRNKVDWHMAKDDPTLTTMRFIPKHETVQKYGAMLPGTLTNQAIKESDAYKTYHDFAIGKVIPKPKYVRRSTTEKTDQSPTASPGKRLKATTKKSRNEDNDDEVILSKDDDDNDDNEDDDGQDDDNEQTELDNDDEEDKEEEGLDLRVQTPSHFESTDDEAYDEVTQGDNVEEEELDEEETNEEEEVNELYRDVNVNLERRDTEMTNALQTNVQGFISNMLNPNPYTGINPILNLNTESTSLVDVLVTTNVEIPPSSITTPPSPPIPLIQPLQQTLVPTPTIVPSSFLQNLPTFGSLFKFKDRVKALEDDFLEFKQTNLFTKAVSLIPGIIDKYLANQMNEVVKASVQLQSDKLREEAQAENENFINKIDENIKKIIKEQVKIQVKEQVTKILPKIKKSVNEQLEAEVLIRSSSEAKTSHVVVAKLSELELKKILIDKMENNKSIDRSVPQRNLYKALVDAYESEKVILATYGDTVTLKRRRDDEDDDEEPSAGSNWGSKRRRAGKEPESTSPPKEKTSKSTGKSKEGSKSHQKSTDPRESFNELMDTPLDFLAFVLNWRKVDTLTPELLAVNREYARDVYSRNRIIGIKKLTIVEWHNYKHLEWITIRRDDDKLYTFKEGYYNRLHLQDIEDMLLLLIQGKLTNLNIKECLSLGVSLRMFTRSTVIRRRMEDF
ncbi:hypothetical protein Tco_1428395 [Tanacetum coccineum]